MGEGSDVGQGDDRPHLAAAGRKGAFEEPPAETRGLTTGPDEELGELEEAVALDRSGIPNERAVGLVLGHPPLGGLRPEMGQQGFQAQVEGVPIERPLDPLAREQLFHGRHRDVEGLARVIRRSAADPDRGIGGAFRRGIGLRAAHGSILQRWCTSLET
jgi:hypothetical protein